MNPKKIIIATIAILLLSGFLTGCELLEKVQEEPAKETALQQIVQKAKAAKKEVSMVLKAEREEGQIKVKITLDNPNQKPVTSIQSWLSFDPAKVQGREINTEKSAFSIVAPYDNDFDNENGLVMLGRGNPDPITAKTIEVAEVVFDVVGEGTIMIDVYDYREDLTGHTSANTITDGEPYNILIKPDSPTLVIEN